MTQGNPKVMKHSRQEATLAHHACSVTSSLPFLFSPMSHHTHSGVGLSKILVIPKPSASLLNSFLLFFTKTNQLPPSLFPQCWR